jgi:uncharacterized protein
MSLLLDLSRFRGGVERVDRTDDPAAFGPPTEDFRITAPVVFSAEVRKDAQKARLVGTVRTSLELPCSRCLEPFTIPVDAAFDLLFLPASEDVSRGEHEIHADDAAVSFYEDDVIDLAEVMREQLYLALPMKPLCRENCLGLCPVCGVNRNTETCSCQPAWVDPRMEALRSLKKDS